MHVAIIMDGNGRWAQTRGMSRWRGHVAGMESVREVVKAAPELGVTTLTLYAFSCDNWKRPKAEVGRLFWLLQEYCDSELKDLVEAGVRVSHVGRRDRLPPGAVSALDQMQAATAGGTRLDLRLAIDYGSRWAIAEAAQRIAREMAAGHMSPEDLTTEAMQRAIAGDTPDPDLVIRTAGEQRLSDFLLWESAYAELHFSSVPWPEFRREHLAAAVGEFHGRERRFGGLKTPDTATEPASLAEVSASS